MCPAEVAPNRCSGNGVEMPRAKKRRCLIDAQGIVLEEGQTQDLYPRHLLPALEILRQFSA